eukprot:TRINITY_DN15641_c0_g1_i4.p2 TRINITY_DN15641_c0_g1~~TRINITY_DN15641_c0_g1_i4.p2  ORF type:complete len:101 (-),score=4.63 TRINITY_DN15641_c0_g1_i4:95-397(-)
MTSLLEWFSEGFEDPTACNAQNALRCLPPYKHERSLSGLLLQKALLRPCHAQDSALIVPQQPDMSSLRFKRRKLSRAKRRRCTHAHAAEADRLSVAAQKT